MMSALFYKEIKEHINVPKSTLSLWLKDVPLKPEYKQRLYTKQIEILARGASSQKERRKREIDEIIKNAKKEISTEISQETSMLFGAALYWAEGNKKGEFKITNSDPRLILFMVHWLKTTFDIEPSYLKIHLNMYSQQDESDLKKFWSYLTKIPLKNFGKSFIKPTNKNYKKNNLYYGTVQIYVPRSTDKKHRVFGWIQAVLQNTESQVELAEQKWVSLKKISRPINLDYNNYKPL